MFQGATTLLSGMRMLLSEDSLRSVLWRMLGLLLVLMFALIFGVFSLAEHLAQLWLPSGDAWYWVLLSWIVWLLAIVLSLFTGVVSFTALGSAAVAPWLDTLALKTEQLQGKVSKESDVLWWQHVLGSLMNSLRPLLDLMVWGIAALLVIWIPLIGQFAATVIWGYAGIRFLCFELMDTTASRQGKRFAERKSLLAEQRFFWLGFGGLGMVMMMVPLLNLLVIPAAVVALSHRGDMYS
jgi:CysZ protein